MTASVISIVSSALSFLGVVIVAALNARSTQEQIRQQHSVQIYRLEQLEQKVQAHNNLVSRMYDVERDIAILKAENDDGR